jgi:ABC-type glutathione transport system ATPase component
VTHIHLVLGMFCPGVTIIMVTHDLRVAGTLTEIIWLRDGRVDQASPRHRKVNNSQHAPGRDPRHHVVVLGGLRADQLVGVGRVRVNVRRDPAARPVRQPGDRIAPGSAGR